MNNEQGIKTSNLWKERVCSEDMMFQTQSKSYQEWMKEDEWDQAVEALSVAATLPLAEFKA
jgi:hypothetical protein